MARKIIDQYSFRFKKGVDPRVKLFPLLQDNLNDTITYLIEKEIAENGLRNLQMFIPSKRKLLGSLEKDLANLTEEELELYNSLVDNKVEVTPTKAHRKEEIEASLSSKMPDDDLIREIVETSNNQDLSSAKAENEKDTSTLSEVKNEVEETKTLTEVIHKDEEKDDVQDVSKSIDGVEVNNADEHEAEGAIKAEKETLTESNHKDEEKEEIEHIAEVQVEVNDTTKDEIKDENIEVKEDEKASTKTDIPSEYLDW